VLLSRLPVRNRRAINRPELFDGNPLLGGRCASSRGTGGACLAARQHVGDRTGGIFHGRNGYGAENLAIFGRVKRIHGFFSEDE
jgi:hypothetical protein